MIECIIDGTCIADILVRPVPLSAERTWPALESLTQYRRSTADLYNWRHRIAGAITSSTSTEVNPWQDDFRLKKSNPRQP